MQAEEADILAKMGDNASKQGRADEARMHYNAAIQIETQLGNQNGIALGEERLRRLK